MSRHGAPSALAAAPEADWADIVHMWSPDDPVHRGVAELAGLPQGRNVDRTWGDHESFRDVVRGVDRLLALDGDGEFQGHLNELRNAPFQAALQPALPKELIQKHIAPQSGPDPPKPDPKCCVVVMVTCDAGLLPAGASQCDLHLEPYTLWSGLQSEVAARLGVLPSEVALFYQDTGKAVRSWDMAPPSSRVRAVRRERFDWRELADGWTTPAAQRARATLEQWQGRLIAGPGSETWGTTAEFYEVARVLAGIAMPGITRGWSSVIKEVDDACRLLEEKVAAGASLAELHDLVCPDSWNDGTVSP